MSAFSETYFGYEKSWSTCWSENFGYVVKSCSLLVVRAAFQFNIQIHYKTSYPEQDVSVLSSCIKSDAYVLLSHW
jgi:uncharacterized membrane protein YagU involved in acid resistance